MHTQKRRKRCTGSAVWNRSVLTLSHHPLLWVALVTPLIKRRGDCRAVALLNLGNLALAPLKRLKSVSLKTTNIRVSAFALDLPVSQCGERQRARRPACSIGKMLFLLFLVASPKSAEAASQPCWRGHGWEWTGGGEGALAKWGKRAQAVNLRKDFGAGRMWFNPIFLHPAHLELTLRLEQKALLQPIPL